MAVIKDTTRADLNAVADCHRSAFPDTLTSALGRAYCRKMLEWYLSTDRAFIFHIEHDNKVVGYCGGIIVDGTLAHGSASSMTQYSFDQAVKSFIKKPWLLFHKEMIKRYDFVLRNIYRKLWNKKGRTTLSNPTEPNVGLVVIGVDKKFQQKGFGAQLLVHFEKVTRQKGFKVMKLTVNSKNEKAIRSYKQNGWIEQEVRGESLSMVKRI
ncbi:MAG: GNAT family N-acetyltransferase [Bacteroidota bacterium]